jgi:hypothetical protein
LIDWLIGEGAKRECDGGDEMEAVIKWMVWQQVIGGCD